MKFSQHIFLSLLSFLFNNYLLQFQVLIQFKKKQLTIDRLKDLFCYYAIFSAVFAKFIKFDVCLFAHLCVRIRGRFICLFSDFCLKPNNYHFQSGCIYQGSQHPKYVFIEGMFLRTFCSSMPATLTSSEVFERKC